MRDGAEDRGGTGLPTSSGRMNSPRRMRSERPAGTVSGELMGRTPVVKELGPGGGVGTIARSESDCEIPGLPGGVRGSMERRAGARSAIAVDTARWISAWRFADMTAALVTLGGRAGWWSVYPLRGGCRGG